MKKNFYKNKLSEDFIITNYLKKLNFKKKGTFNFDNDGSYLTLKKNKKLVITTDSISENLDFFKNDDPKSIAKKIITVNLSDLSAMGSYPYAYTLNLFLPKYINKNWLNIFTDELFKMQKKYKFYLLGGDLSKSNQLKISATFFGFSKNDKVTSQNKLNSGDDIWITGNLGDSYIGLQILKSKLSIKNKKLKNYFLNKYYYPEPCMVGSKLNKYIKSSIDISDGFIGDLKKMLKYKYGAILDINKIPISKNLNQLLNLKKIHKKNLLNTGDNYDLIIIANKKFRSKLLSIAKKEKVKITLVGKVINDVKIINDSDKPLNISKEFDHFL